MTKALRTFSLNQSENGQLSARRFAYGFGEIGELTPSVGQNLPAPYASGIWHPVRCRVKVDFPQKMDVRKAIVEGKSAPDQVELRAETYLLQQFALSCP